MVSVPQEARPKVETQNKGTGWLLGGLGLVGTIPALVGIGTGELPQMVRNHSEFTLIALGCVIVAVACGFTAGYVISGNAKRERRWLGAGLLFMVVGLSSAVVAGVLTWLDQPEPSVTAVAVPSEEGTKVRLTVKAHGVQAEDDATVRVHPLIRHSAAGHEDEFDLLPAVHAVSVGPSSSGDIDYSTEISLPPGKATDVEVRAWIGEAAAHCYVRGGKTGCVTVALNRNPEPPQLSTDWKDPTDGGKGLTITVSARDISGRRLTLYVEGRAARNRRLRLAHARWAPDARGTAQRSLTIPIDAAVSRVCVVASTSQASPLCPPREDAASAWIKLRAPRARAR